MSQWKFIHARVSVLLRAVIFLTEFVYSTAGFFTSKHTCLINHFLTPPENDVTNKYRVKGTFIRFLRLCRYIFDAASFFIHYFTTRWTVCEIALRERNWFMKIPVLCSRLSIPLAHFFFRVRNSILAHALLCGMLCSTAFSRFGNHKPRLLHAIPDSELICSVPLPSQRSTPLRHAVL